MDAESWHGLTHASHPRQQHSNACSNENRHGVMLCTDEDILLAHKTKQVKRRHRMKCVMISSSVNFEITLYSPRPTVLARARTVASLHPSLKREKHPLLNGTMPRHTMVYHHPGSRRLHTAHQATPEYTSRVRTGAADVNCVDILLRQSVPAPSWVISKRP